MAGVRQHGWKASPAVRSGYGANTLPTRFRSADRFRLVRTPSNMSKSAVGTPCLPVEERCSQTATGMIQATA